MFRGDFEFHEDAAPSHLGGGRKTGVDSAQSDAASEPSFDAVIENVTPEQIQVAVIAATHANSTAAADTISPWGADAEKELRKVPFFVRGKARRNTERYAQEHGVSIITIETLYDAKAHFSR